MSRKSAMKNMNMNRKSSIGNMSRKSAMKNMKKIAIELFMVLIFLISVSLASSQFQISSYTSGASSSYVYSQYYRPSFQEFYSREGLDYSQYWNILDSASCEARQDFILNIRPGGCTPAVVRSDLLEEQNVPVFCKLDAIKINPLIDVSWIRTISFKGKYPKEVAGVGFHPARAALRIYGSLLSSPVLNNIGYVVIVLKRNPKEKEMPKSVKIELNGYIEYDIQKAFGTGRNEFYVPVLTDEKWHVEYPAYSFWKGKGYVRVDNIIDNRARISLYRDEFERISSITLEKAQTSNIIYLPGYYCRVGVRIRVDELVSPKIKASIRIDDSEYQIRKGERFFDNKCQLVSIEPLSEGGSVGIKCQGKNYYLSLGAANSVILEREGNENTYTLGGFVEKDEKEIYFVYAGESPRKLYQEEREREERTFIVLVKSDKNNFNSYLADDESMKQDVLEKISSSLKNLQADDESKFKEEIKKKVKSIFTAKGREFEVDVAFFRKESRQAAFGYNLAELSGVADKDYSNSANGKLLEEYFNESVNTASDIVRFYSAEKKEDGEIFGKDALLSASDLAGEIKKQKTQKDLLQEFLRNYKNDYAQTQLGLLERYSYKNAVADIEIDKQIHRLSLLDITEPGLSDANAIFLISNVAGEKKLGINDVLNLESGEVSGENFKLYRVEEKKDILIDDKKIKAKVFATSEGDFIIYNKKYYKLDEKNASEVSISDYDIAELSLNKEITLENNRKANADVLKTNSDEYAYYSGRVYKLDNNIFRIYQQATQPKSIELKELENNYATIGYSYVDGSGKFKSENRKINLGESLDLENIRLRLIKINLNKEAKITLLPEMPQKYTQVNFTTTIGIEKRAIKLSPEKTREMIENLNKTIERWNSIIQNLGKLVEGMKGACFATSTLLLAKNFFSNLGGGTEARQSVMKKWYSICEKEAQGDRSRFNSCLKDNNQYIEADVNAYKSNVEKINKIVIKIQDMNKNKYGAVEQKTAIPALKQELKTMYGSEEIQFYERDANGNLVPERDSEGKIMKDEQGNVVYKRGEKIKIDDYIEEAQSIPELANLALGIENKKSSGGGKISEIGESLIEPIAYKLYDRKQVKDKTEETKTVFGNLPVQDVGEIIPSGYDGKKFKDVKNEGYALPQDVSENDAAQAVRVKGEPYIAVLREIKKGSGQYRAEKWYKIVGDNLELFSPKNEIEGTKFNYLNSIQFSRQDAASLINPWAEAKVRFHGSGSFKGLPAIVPLGERLGRQEGWYAATKPYDIGNLENLKAYTESALLRNFWICNVGANKKEEFESALRDDRCQLVNLDVQYPRAILGLDAKKTRELVEASITAIGQAASQYASGLRSLRVLDGTFDLGNPAIASGGRCQDFMSPEDCYLLFNVCDPVMCPTSRCDLGGAYPVEDVVQSGIIGSIALCLPNINEGIFIPVCLTGIHAGLDAYVSILKAHRDCLQENLNTGRHVGICDEIYSIYLCEFFWRQFAPLIDLLIPKMIEMAYGQGTRGGGEYLTVQQSWQNLQSSINFMKNDYAVNAYKAFQKRSVSEAGSSFCRMFISSPAPALKALLKPESPVQFSAWFDEVPFTEATVPATSHYKVFYHIYAGKDEGAYFSVYLKSPPESSFYMSQPYITVATGFIGRGQYADETRDFTAPAGYKELCVRINDQDKCGFKQVSTSFALNYVREKYLEEQATQEIKSEKECIEGTPSLLPLVNPNIQAGAEEAAMPEIYKRGIVRICSSINPANSTEPSRYRAVGYCDSEDVICWLDTATVEENIRNKNILNRTLDRIQNISNEIEGVDYYDERQTFDKLSEIRQEVSEFLKSMKLSDLPLISSSDFKNSKIGKISYKLDDLAEKGMLNAYKAEALFLRYQLFEAATKKIYKTIPQSKVSPVIVETPAEETSQVKEEETEETTTPTTLGWEEEIKKEWKDGMLESNVLIIVKSSYFNKDFTSKYLSNRWVTNTESAQLSGKGYVEGIIQLVKNTNVLGGKIIINKETISNFGNSDKEMAEKVLNLLAIRDNNLA